MSDFFAARIRASASDFAILRGVIAEAEGKSPDAITVKIEGERPDADDPADDLEKMFK